MHTHNITAVFQRTRKAFCAGLLSAIVVIPSISSGDQVRESGFNLHGAAGLPVMLSDGGDRDSAAILSDHRRHGVSFSGKSDSVVSLSDLSVSEGDGTAEVTVTLTPVSNARVAVTVYTRSFTATRGQDFYGTFERIVFEAGESEKTFSVTLIDDDQPEEEEMLRVWLGNIEGASEEIDSAFITIADDDGEPTRFLSVRDFDVSEYTSVATVPVLLDRASIDPVSVIAYTQPVGSAKPGLDFYGLAETVTFNPGETVKFLNLNIIDDSEQEETESLAVRLGQARGAQIADGDATVTITDNDEPVELSIFDLTIGERVGVARITARLSRPSTDVVKATVFSQSGTAIDGLDYDGIESTLVFQPGETFQPVLVTIINDQETESPETFTLNMVDVENAEVPDATSTVTILDSD